MNIRRRTPRPGDEQAAWLRDYADAIGDIHREAIRDRRANPSRPAGVRLFIPREGHVDEAIDQAVKVAAQAVRFIADMRQKQRIDAAPRIQGADNE